MSNELTKNLPNDVPNTEPTILTLMDRLTSMQELMDKRHIETQELIGSVRDDVNQRAQQNYELLASRIDLLSAQTDANFRKQNHLIEALNDNHLRIRGDQRELFERVSALEENAS